MTKFKMILAAASLSAALLGASVATAQTPSETFFTAGSSAQFNTFGVAASLAIPPAAYPLCGSNHWSKKNSSSLPITLVDPRQQSIAQEPGNIWIAWDNSTSPTVVCAYMSVDSIVGVRSYMANSTLSLASGLVGTSGANLVPLIGSDTTLPQAVYAIVNGHKLNAANTDIRPEDAKFATMRVLTTLGAQVTGRGVTGQGYGPFPVGTPIVSEFSGAIANPVDFAIDPGDVDPVNSANPIREYIDLQIGAAPVMVVANVSNTASGHLGDGNYANINRFELAKALEGGITHIRDLGYTTSYNANYNTGVTPTVPYTNTEPDEPLHVFVREPLSGTFNTMEWSVPMAREIDGDDYEPSTVLGQETGVQIGTTFVCTTFPCSGTASGTGVSDNPLYHTTSNGSSRGRAVGTGDMINAIVATPDSIGYAFWGFSTYQGKTGIKYLTVDGVDPLFSASSVNSSGPGVFPACTVTGGIATSCPLLPFTNILNGSYPIWSKYCMMYDPTDSTSIATTIVKYAENASDLNAGFIADMVPAKSLQVFHSHYAQVIRDSGVATTGNNGFKLENAETGGDMGGAVLTIAGELDINADTGNQQVNLLQ